ncbi:leucine-rich repeat domain-containing protein [Listeria monocytogenes]|nr:leucine-rich repeat domain-containing protein [Listeria monocytogenes]
MNIKWKIILLFILFLILVAPFYSKAMEKEGQDVSKSTEEPEKITTDQVNKMAKKTVTKEKQVPLKAALPAIPPNSKISNVFPDPGMANAIARALNLNGTSKLWNSNSIIKQDDLNTINRIDYQFERTTKPLSPDNPRIKSIEGIQYCTNIMTIYVTGNSIQDLSPLLKAPNGFPNLTDLNLSYNMISDISIIPRLRIPAIQIISLDGNRITNISSFKDIANTSRPRLAIVHLDGQVISYPKLTVSSKKEFSIKHKIPIIGIDGATLLPSSSNGTFNSMTSTFTWSKQEMMTKPTSWKMPGMLPPEERVYPWTYEDVSGVRYNREVNYVPMGRIKPSFQVYFWQPLDYLGPPKITSANTEITYEANTSITERKFLTDAKIITDQQTTLTSDFNSKISSTTTAGVYNVTVKASNIEGDVEQKVKVTIKNKRPVLTAAAEYTYLVGDTVSSSQFQSDVNAKVTGAGAIQRDIRDNFSSAVNLNRAGVYIVKLSTPSWPPLTDAANPITVKIHVKEGLEMQVPDDFRMGLNSSETSVPISNQKQTLKYFGSAGNTEIKILDRRRVKKGWTITGAMTPFTNSKRDILETTLKYKSQTAGSSTVYLNTINQPLEKKQASTLGGEVYSTFNLQDNLTMEIEPHDAIVNDAYNAKITWTLEDVPR